LRDLAGVIALAYEAREYGVARGLLARLENTDRAPDSLNTQEQAFLLRAAHAMAASAGPVSIQAAGAVPLGADRWAVGRPADSRFVNHGRGAVWRTVTVSGRPTTPPPAASSGLTLDKRLFGLDGRPIDPLRLKQGDRFIVRLSGRAAAQRPELTVVDDALPAGFEIDSTLTPADAQGEQDENGKAKAGPFTFLGPLSSASVQEKRDDRYIAALNLAGGKPFALAYVARAVTPGSFYLPGAEAKDMYRPAISARTAHGRTVITP
jgi:alpha-2-macroglobulin